MNALRKLILASLAAALVLPASAASPDARAFVTNAMASYAADGHADANGAWTVPSEGVTATSDAGTPTKIEFEVDAGSELSYAPKAPSPLGLPATVSVTGIVMKVGYEAPAPDDVDGKQAALAVLQLDGDTSPSYYGWAGGVDPDDATKLVWIKLAGPTFVEGQAVDVEMAFDYSASPATVTFKVGTTTLADASDSAKTAFELAGTKRQVTSVAFGGAGSFTGLGGSYDWPQFDVKFFDGATEYADYAQVVASNAVAVAWSPSPDPEKPGYKFDCWTNGVAAYDFATPVTADLNLGAKWSLNAFTITWNVEGTETTSTVEPGVVPAFEGTPKKAQDDTYTYEFAGWSTTSGGSVIALPGASADATYFAVFTPVYRDYTVTWNFKAADGTDASDTTTVHWGATPSHAEPAGYVANNTIYAFQAWSPAPAAYDGTVIAYTATYTSTAAAAMVISVADAETGATTTNYVATLAAAFGGNGAKDGDTVELLANVTLTERVEPNVGANTAITIDLGGYTITREGTSGNGSVFDVKSGDVTITNGVIVCTQDDTAIAADGVYAITSRSGSNVTLADLTVTVDSECGACVYPFAGSTMTIESGTYANLTTTPYRYNTDITGMAVNQPNIADQLLIIKGGSFSPYDPQLGDDSGAMTDFTDDGFVAIDDGNGNWVVQAGYNVTFDANGGTPTPPAQRIPAGETATAPTAPAAENLDFLGWFASGATDAYDFTAEVTADLVLTAAWDVSYTAAFDKDAYTATGGGVMSMKVAIVRADGATLTTDDKDGWTVEYDSARLETSGTPVWSLSTGTVTYKAKRNDAGFDTATGTVTLKRGDTVYDTATLSVAPSAAWTFIPSIANGAKRMVESGPVTVSSVKVNGIAVDLADYTVTSDDASLATIAQSGSSATVTPVSAGKATFTLADGNGGELPLLVTFVDAAAKIGDVFYDELGRAVRAAAAGDVIELCRDVTESIDYDGAEPRVDGFAFAIDLAGHAWTAGADKEFAFKLSYGSVTIKDTVGGGSVASANGPAFVANHLANNAYSAKLVLEDGTFRGLSSVVRAGYVSAGKYYGGDVEILGGTFESATTGAPELLEVLAAGSAAVFNESSIAVKGGSFKSFDPSDADGDMVATGYVSVADDPSSGWFTVYEAVTVTFADDKVTPPEAQVIGKGKTATEPTAPAFTGWTFEGWFAPEATEAFDFGTAIDADITLTAKWTQNEYDVIWVAHGTQFASNRVAHGTAMPVPTTNPTKDGDDDALYTFVKWTPAQDATVTSNATYTAEFKTWTKVAVPTAAANLVYTGAEQIGVAAGTGYTLSGDAVGTDAGDYTATASLADAENTVWADATEVNTAATAAKTIEWSIDKASVTVKANDDGKTYNESDPAVFTATVTGLIGSDTVAYTVSREAGEEVGTYTITPTGETEQGNYTVTYQTGTFTIDPIGTFTIIWLAGDGSKIAEEAVEANTSPSRTPPEKSDPTDKYTYEFAGWKDKATGTVYHPDALPPATAAATYQATYTQSIATPLALPLAVHSADVTVTAPSATVALAPAGLLEGTTVTADPAAAYADGTFTFSGLGWNAKQTWSVSAAQGEGALAESVENGGSFYAKARETWFTATASDLKPDGEWTGYTPENNPSAEGEMVRVSTRVEMPAEGMTTPPKLTGADKGAFTVLKREGDAEAAYYAFDGQGWVKLAGAKPAGAEVDYLAVYDFAAAEPTVRYYIDGVALYAEGEGGEKTYDIGLKSGTKQLSGIWFQGADAVKSDIVAVQDVSYVAAVGDTPYTAAADAVTALAAANKAAANDMTITLLADGVEGSVALAAGEQVTVEAGAWTSGLSFTASGAPAYKVVETAGVPATTKTYSVEAALATVITIANNGATTNTVGTYATLQAALDAAKTANAAETVVTLNADASIEISKDGNVLGGAAAKKITIDGNGKTLNVVRNGTWAQFNTAHDATLVLQNVSLTSEFTGTQTGWVNDSLQNPNHNIAFNCDVELKDVNSANALSFWKDAALDTVEIEETVDVYSIWIHTTADSVSIKDLTVNTSAGRGIKVDDSFVAGRNGATPSESTAISVDGASFTTKKKSAILVRSAKPIDITTSGTIDISGVPADTQHVVWVDEDAADKFGLVTLNGAQADLVPEPISDGYAATLSANGTWIDGYYKTLAAAVAAADSTDTVTLLKTVDESFSVAKDLTITRNGYSAEDAVAGEGYFRNVTAATYVYFTGAVAQVGDTYYTTLQAALDAVKTANAAESTVELLDDASIEISKTGNVLGGAAATKITINGNGKTLNVVRNGTWAQFNTANGAKLVLNGINLTSEFTGTQTGWVNDSGQNPNHNIAFSCDVELKDVNSDNALSFWQDASLDTVKIEDTADVYSIWVHTTADNISIKDLTVNTTAGRGIKVDDSYVAGWGGTPSDSTTVAVNGAKFTTQNRKSAILVRSAKPIDITTSGTIDISGVPADTQHVVWVDEDAADKFGLVTLNGAQSELVPEPITGGYAATLSADGTWIDGYYKTLAAAVAVADADYVAANAGYELTLLKTVDETFTVAQDLTIMRTADKFAAESVTAGEGWFRNVTDEAYVFTGRKPINGTTITVAAAGGIYSGSAYTLDSVKDGETDLVENTDYTVSYTDNVNVGTVTATLVGIGAYTDTTNVTFAITPLSVTVTAASATKVYDGDALTKDDYTAGALAAGDTIAAATVTGSQTDVGVSSNKVVVTSITNAVGAEVIGNYAITAVDGELKVTPATITITVAGYTGVYDGEAHEPTLEVVPADATVVWSTDGGETWGDTVPSITDFGTKTVVAKASKANYNDATSESATLQVTRKAVTVTADDASKKHGEADPASFAATPQGLVGSDTVSYTVSRVAGEDIGTYAITPSGDAIQGNYEVTFKPGTFTIEENKITIIWVVDGNETTNKVEWGDMPAFAGSTDKASDAKYDYTFKGWTPTVTKATVQATYTAGFSKTIGTPLALAVADEKLSSTSVSAAAKTATVKADLIGAVEGVTVTEASGATVTIDEATATASFSGLAWNQGVEWKMSATQTAADDAKTAESAELPGKFYVKPETQWFTATADSLAAVADGSDAAVGYTAPEASSEGEMVRVHTTVEVPAGGLPQAPETGTAKVGFAVLQLEGDAAPAFYAYGNGAWTKLAGVEPKAGTVDYLAVYDLAAETPTARYYIDGVALYKPVDGGDDVYALPLGSDVTSLKSISFASKEMVKSDIVAEQDVSYVAAVGETPYTDAEAAVTAQGKDPAKTMALLRQNVGIAPVSLGATTEKFVVDYTKGSFTNDSPAVSTLAGYAVKETVDAENDKLVTYGLDAIEYRIAYDLALDGASLPEGYPTNFTVETLPVALPVASREGWTFKGWTNNVSDNAIAETIPAGTLVDVDNVGQWEINKYLLTVNYLYTNGTVAATQFSSNVVYDTAYSVDSPVIAGYTADKLLVSGMMGAAPVTVDVTYTVNRYTVAFVDEDGTVLKAATEYDYGTLADAIAKPETPTKAATAEKVYTFSGWKPAVETVTSNAVYKASYSEADTKAAVISVAQDGTTNTIYVATIADAIAAAGDGDTIQLIGDVEGNATIEKDVTIDLNGNTWTGNVSVAGDVTIVDGSDGADGKLDGSVAVADGGSVEVAGGTVDDGITGAGDVVVSGGTVNGGITGAGKIDVSGGTVNGGITGSGEIAVSGGTVNGGVVAKGEGAKATIAGGTISDGVTVADGATGTISGEDTVVNGDLSGTEEALVVTGGHFEKDPSDNVADGYYADGDDTNGYDVKERKSLEGAVITVADATYSGSAQAPAPVVKVDDETLELGKDFVAVYATNDLVNADTYDVTIVAIGAWIGSAETTFTIVKAPLSITANDATVKRGKGLDTVTFDYEYAGFVGDESAADLTTQLSDPVVTNALGAAYSTTARTGDAYVIVPTGATAANYEITFVDGTLTVVAGAIAKVDETEYEAIADAVTAAGKTEDGKVITMLDDADAAVVFAFGDVLKVALEGFDLTVKVSDADALRYRVVASDPVEGVTTYTVEEIKANGLMITEFDYEGAYLVYNTGKAEDLAWDSDKAYCTVVTATDLKAARWNVVGGTSTLHSEHGANQDVKVENLDTSAPVRFFRIAVTPYVLSVDDTVEFAPAAELP